MSAAVRSKMADVFNFTGLIVLNNPDYAFEA